MEVYAKEYEHLMKNEKMGKLIMRFALPCIIAMVVNALYLTIDQIFIGQGVGYVGNAATNVALPFDVLALGISILIGGGAAAFFSIKLGERDTVEAAQTVGNALSLFIISGLFFMVIGYVFMKNLLWAFGATTDNFQYAYDYMKISLIGIPFLMIASGFSSIIIADGSPQYSMISICSGAVMNLILDPVFIFVFHMGVKGAAIATVIGEMASFLVCISYITRFKTFKFEKKLLKMKFDIIKNIIFFGLSGFIIHIAVTILVVTSNNMLTKYGAESIYGSDIPLSSMGIVMKVNEILLGVLIGISTGGQPILGYNYGAKNNERVKETYLMLVKLSTIASACAFIIFQFFPQYIIDLFGQNNELYNDFALKSFRIFLMLCIFSGFEIITSSFFQSIGHPIKSIILTLCKQTIFIIPLIIILPRYFGVMGVLYAGPIAEALSTSVVFGFAVYEIKKLSCK